MRHRERHRSERIAWLRAAVLGSNDGIVSTASLIAGVAAAGTSRSQVIIAGIAGLVAGAMSMAAGEYVSVSFQSDTQEADLALERQELTTDESGERAELTGIYVARGLEPALARQARINWWPTTLSVPTPETNSEFPMFSVRGLCRRLSPRRPRFPWEPLCRSRSRLSFPRTWS
jgi:hypothetical protein